LAQPVYSVDLFSTHVAGPSSPFVTLVPGFVYVVRDIDAALVVGPGYGAQLTISWGGYVIAQWATPSEWQGMLQWRGRSVRSGGSGPVVLQADFAGASISGDVSIAGYQLSLP